MATNLIGYSRVSTRDQHPESQADALREAGCAQIFIDRATGKLARRPQLDAALAYLRPGDVLVITRLDRLGRSVHNLIELAETLREREVGLRVLHQGIDTTTPAGRMFFHMLAAIAEFEAALISERTHEGLAAARARGRKGGRRPKLSDRQVTLVRQMHASGEHTIAAIAETFGVTRPTVYRVLESDEQPVGAR
jgi:DNA invertase Pin-like site-specific DNA recombinase